MQWNLIIPSWELVNKASLIKKFNFFPSLLWTIFLSFIVLYQISYSYIIIFEKKDQFFSFVLNFAHSSYFIEFLITLIVFFLMYILFLPIAKWWLYYLIDAYSKQDIKKYTFSYWISQWLLNFLPLFEFNNFMWLFKLLSIITSYLFLIRILWKEYILLISLCIWIYFIFAIIVNILFIYTTFFIIFEKKGLFESISFSVKMTINNLSVTFKLYYTLFLVYARIIITILTFLFLSVITSFVFAYITSSFIFVIWITIIIIMVIIFIIFTSYLNSVLEIFVDSLWYKTYIENMKTFEFPINKDDIKK
jgi:hypothetical protein